MSSPRKRASQKPLSGIRILVGRARHQASALSAGLKKLGAEVIEIPFIEIRAPRSYNPLDSALKGISKYDWLILTSVNGVDAVAARLKRLKIKLQALSSVQVAAIGPSTLESAEKLGLTVAIVPKQYVAESVVESLRGKVEGKRVLLARAEVARDVIPRAAKDGRPCGCCGSLRDGCARVVAEEAASTDERPKTAAQRDYVYELFDSPEFYCTAWRTAEPQTA
jgi:hypothetical protein